MADPLGVFAPELVPEGWFDETAQAAGWFDAGNLDADTGPDTVDDLIAVNVTAGAPTVGSPAIGQTHDITATGVTAGTSTVGAPTIGQVHDLTATGVTAGVPSAGTPTFREVHGLDANGVTAGAPTVGTPTLGEAHNLEAIGVTAGVPTVGSPELAEDGGVIETPARRGDDGGTASGKRYPAIIIDRIRDIVETEREKQEQDKPVGRKRKKRIAKQIVVAAGKNDLLPELITDWPEVKALEVDFLRLVRSASPITPFDIQQIIADLEAIQLQRDIEDEEETEMLLLAA